VIDEPAPDLADRVFAAMEHHLDAVSVWENEGGALLP
jgi:hypothetical protein